MSVGRIVVDLLAKTGSFETDINRAAKLAEKRAKEIDDSLRQAGAAVGTAVAAGAAVAAVAIKASIDRMDELSKAALKVQMPTEELSKLAYAGGLADVSVSDLESALGKLTKSQAAALKGTSEQAQVFEALGISVKKADGSLRGSGEVLADFADKFAAAQDSPELMAAGMAIFGKSFQGIIPLIKDGSQGLREAGDEAERLGLVLTTEAGQSAEAFNDNLTRLQGALDGVTSVVAAQLAPHLNELTDQLVELAKEGNGAAEIADSIGAAFDLIGGAAVVVSSTVRGVTFDLIAMGNAGQAALAALRGDFKGAAANLREAGAARSLAEAESADIERVFSGRRAASKQPSAALSKQSAAQVQAEQEAEQMRQRLAAVLSGGASKSKAGKSRGGKSEAEREAEALQAQYESLIGAQQQQIALFGEAGEAARVRYEVENGALAALEPALKAVAVANAEKLDTLREEADVQAELDAINKRREESAQDVLATIREEIGLIGMSAEQQEIWNNLKWAGVDANSALGQSIADTTRELQNQRETLGTQITLMDDFRQGAANALTDFATGMKSAKDAAIDFFDSFAERITQMIAERWMEQLFGQAGTTGTGTSGGNWIGMALGALFGGGRAGGGRVDNSHGYLVGERGPELFIPATAGTVIPAEQTRRMGGGGATLNQTFVVQGAPDRRTREQLARESGRAAARGMARTGR
ncbi:hypothetical protein ACFFGH_06650 [Lysobacter korlensis]|uniref:Uncharacterized protein n=1 Tax=Lysobacter korlensis TaxID=553636 RepID=A0ABV6RLS9_9GAMM